VTVTNNTTAVLLLDPKWIGNEFIFSFVTQPGHNYDVEDTAELTGGTWQLLDTLVGNGASLSVTNANANGGQHFYRVRLN
jgi:hypothetical protein